MTKVYHRRLTDPDTIREFLIEDELWERISFLGQSKDFDVPIMDEIHWIGLFIKPGTLVGLIMLHEVSAVTTISHINIHKKYRYLSVEAGIAGGHYMLSKTKYSKFIAEIPVTYPDVIKYAMQVGYQKEGTNRKSILVAGKMIDQIHLGITRDEMKTKFIELTKGVI